MRIALGFLVTTAALTAAIWLNNAKLDAATCRDGKGPVACSSVAGAWSSYAPRDGSIEAGGSIQDVLPRVEHPDRRADWQSPLVAVLAVAGIGLGIAVVVSTPRQPSAG
jgi:hypothetical protein